MSESTYGIMLTFDTAPALLNAVRALRRAGFQRMETYAPFAVEGLDEALGLRRNAIARVSFIAGAVGGLGTLGMQYFAAAINYPIRVGGRPFASWPAFLPGALEMTLLFAASAGVVAMLVGSGMPRFYHPVFHAEAFDRISQDHFAVVVCSDEPFGDDDIVRALQDIKPMHMQRVPL